MGYFVTLSIGILLLLVSLHFFSTSVNFLKTGNRTIATVDQLEKERSKGKYTYRPIFKFTTVNGKEILYSYKVASSPPDWEVGEKVTIFYQIDDPENPMILTYFGAFGSAIISLIIAMTLLIIGGGYYLFQSYSKQFLL